MSDPAPTDTAASVGSSAPFLTAEWRQLVMLNFAVDPERLRPHVPRGTELDDWQGLHLCSLVGFRFLNTRVRGWAIPGHQHFDEVNLRFYVRRREGGEVRRGVVFLKEIVPRMAISLVANWVYNERYVTRAMRHEITLPTADRPTGTIAYAWRFRGDWIRLTADVHGQPAPLTAGSAAEFITEHYWGYVTQRDGSTMEYAVEHPRWNVWTAGPTTLTGPVEHEYGDDFARVLTAPPASAFVADGSEVRVYAGRKVADPV